MLQTKTLYHFESDAEDDLDECLIVVDDITDANLERATQEARDFLGPCSLIGCYELSWHDSTPCGIAELRPFIG